MNRPHHDDQLVEDHDHTCDECTGFDLAVGAGERVAELQAEYDQFYAALGRTGPVFTVVWPGSGGAQ